MRRKIALARVRVLLPENFRTDARLGLQIPSTQDAGEPVDPGSKGGRVAWKTKPAVPERLLRRSPAARRWTEGRTLRRGGGEAVLASLMSSRPWVRIPPAHPSTA